MVAKVNKITLDIMDRSDEKVFIACANREDSGQHLCSLVRVFTIRINNQWTLKQRRHAMLPKRKEEHIK